MQIILDADVLSVSINGRGAFSASTNYRMMAFGPIALYAGGAGEVRFKEVSYKDLNHKNEPKEIVSKDFQMPRISDFYYGWCAAVADINHLWGGFGRSLSPSHGEGQLGPTAAGWRPTC